MDSDVLINHSEVAYQLNDTEAKILLVHPEMVDTALRAAEKARLPKSQIFQFSDAACPTYKDVKDWESFLGSDHEAQGYQWPELKGDKSLKTIATINYSSGLCLTDLEWLFLVLLISIIRNNGASQRRSNLSS